MVKRMGDSFRIVERGFEKTEMMETSSKEEETEEERNISNVFQKFIRPSRRRVRHPRPSDLGPLNRISVALTKWFTTYTYDLFKNKSSNKNTIMSDEIRQRLSFVHSQCARVPWSMCFNFLRTKRDEHEGTRNVLKSIDTFDVSRAPIDILVVHSHTLSSESFSYCWYTSG